MNQQSKRQTPADIATTSSPADASKLAANLIDLMSALLAVVERETELVRAGKLREALAIEPTKSDLSRRYVAAIGQFKASQKQLSETAPKLLSALNRDHEKFREMLQTNLRVLATAHAVSENLVRSVNAQMQQRNIPNTYTAAGRRSMPGPRHMMPLAVSRSL
jgi:hypothetical protein